MEFRGILLFVVFIACLFSFGEAVIASWETPRLDENTGTSDVDISVAEDKQKDYKIYTFEATPGGENVNVVKYELVTSDTPLPFSISTAGVLTLTGDIDYEGTTKEYEIKVKATDSSDPPQTGVVTVTIKITDVNEHKPEFGKATYEVCVVSGADAGDEITTLSATDKDTGNDIKYSIFSGNTDNAFIVSDDKLIVNTDKKLDKDETPKYTLVIHAEDNGTPQKTGTATYEIEVSTTCNGATALTLTFLTLLLSLIVALL